MRLKVISLLLLICIFTGCKINSKVMKADYEIGVGESFQIELTSNPSTGYAWKWTNKQGISIVEVSDNQYIADHPDRVGGGGKEIWKFKGIKSGIDTLKLAYNRSWESNQSADTRTITVKVK